ncbi:MAG: hypothetical protein J5847_04715 [Clostridia bacterium]|nr:hypothetical protein [Clostridia bacterium]
MNVMFWYGTVCWIFELAVLFWFLYECRDETTKKGYILKGAASSNILIYGTVLTALYAHTSHTAPSRGAILFLIGMLFAFLGDMGLATMQRKHGGSSKVIFSKIASERVTVETLTAGIVGVLFIISFFFQTIAFLRGIHGDIQQFAVPFLVLFLLPPVFGAVLTNILMTQSKMTPVSTNIFIIGIFFALLLSALFAAAAVYSFWVWQEHPNHAIYVFSGALLLFLSVDVLLARYARPEKNDTRSLRAISRTLNFVARMMLAGCAFLL